ncbi:hypothetical protein N7478_002648 [Penicillium angulare]|uniref:uncharacterized protein n=1 Tax=Penicillium angulare TaxID=116970 RepID=UPI00254269FA|nr:uncharacterized protein N7478_002648 [Penicillium angulare]KAJ5286962.1 hypothetical protein N7478_002648 [Penicillium angulare]
MANDSQLPQPMSINTNNANLNTPGPKKKLALPGIQWSKIPENIIPFYTSAWKVSYEPVNLLLNEPDEHKRDIHTQRWLDGMQQQLNTTILVMECSDYFLAPRLQSTLISGVITSSFSWSYFANSDTRPVCLELVKAFWYSALCLSISAIACASQQLVALQRVAIYPDSLTVVRKLLGGNGAAPLVGTKRLGFSQFYLWQLPVMLLSASLYVYIAGLTIIVYWDFATSLKSSHVGRP